MALAIMVLMLFNRGASEVGGKRLGRRFEMSHLVEGLLGWLIWMGLVFGGASVLLIVLSAIRSVVLSVQHARGVRLEAEPTPRQEPQGTRA